MASSSDGGGGLILILALLALYGWSKETPEEDLLVAELGVTEEEASELIETYGSAEVALEDYREDGSYSLVSPYSYGNTEDLEEDLRAPFDEGAAQRAAENELANQGYDGSYGCTSDCSGHDAGWQWRAEHGYSTYGDSNSFSEGGQAFDAALNERVNEMRQDYESGLEPSY